MWSGALIVFAASLLILLAASGRAAGTTCASWPGRRSTWELTDSSYAAYRDVVSTSTTTAPSISAPSEPAVSVSRSISLCPMTTVYVPATRFFLRGLSRIDGYAGLQPARSLDYRDLQRFAFGRRRFVAADASV